MVKYLALLFWLTLPAYAGIKKGDESKSIANDSTQEQKVNVNAFKEDGTIDLQHILDAKLGGTITFKLEGKIIVGTVTEFLFDPTQGARVVGIFSEADKSGFVFVFTKDSKAGGMLFFAEKGEVFNLKADKNVKTFYFEKQKITIKDQEERSPGS